MHPRIAEVLDYVERQRKTLDAAIATIPSARRNERPAEERWSVAEIVEHLAEVEKRITGLIAKQIADAKAKGLAKETDSSSILATIDTKRVLDRTRRITSTTIPTGTVTFADALRQLDAARGQLTSAVMQGDGYDLTAVSAPHRVFGQIHMYEWVAFIGSHMGRHAEQVREIGQQV
jgi:hypothetical protein